MAVACPCALIAFVVVHCLCPQFFPPPTWHAISGSFAELCVEVVFHCRLGDSLLLCALVCLFVGLLCVTLKFHSQVGGCALYFWPCIMAASFWPRFVVLNFTTLGGGAWYLLEFSPCLPGFSLAWAWLQPTEQQIASMCSPWCAR